MKAPFNVIFEDNHLLVVNKASGVLVQGDATGDVPLVDLCKEYVARKFRKPGAVFLGVVHRIDRPVSGIVVLARTSKSLERMNALFRENQTMKTYWAITEHKPPLDSGELIHWLVKDEKRNKTTAYTREKPGSLRSELRYTIMDQRNKQWLLRVNPVTGRPHQIRVQLSVIGCPIMGDVKYGHQQPEQDKSIALHARRLEFIHPVKKEPMIFEAQLPDSDTWRTFLNFKESIV